MADILQFRCKADIALDKKLEQLKEYFAMIKYAKKLDPREVQIVLLDTQGFVKIQEVRYSSLMPVFQIPILKSFSLQDLDLKAESVDFQTRTFKFYNLINDQYIYRELE